MDTNVLEVCSNCFGRIRKVPIELLLLFVLTSLLGFVCLVRPRSHLEMIGDLLNFLWQVYTFVFIVAPEPREPIPSEKHYKTLSENGEVIKPQQLPCWHDIHIRKGDRRKQLPNSPQVAEIEKAELFMSVVVPAYNEEERLGGMLEEAVDYLENAYGTLGLKDEKIPQQNGKVHRRTANGQPNGVNGHGREAESSSKGWEILIVSDGSTDKTVDTALAFARDHQLSQHLKARSGPWTSQSKDAVHIPPGSIRVVSLSQNRGKGGAVTHGMKHVRGAYVVFADADGASKFEDLGKLVKACRGIEDQEFRGIAIGSRAHLVGSEAVIKVRNPSEIVLFYLLCLTYHTALEATKFPDAFISYHSPPSHPTRNGGRARYTMRLQTLLPLDITAHNTLHALRGLDL